MNTLYVVDDVLVNALDVFIDISSLKYGYRIIYFCYITNTDLISIYDEKNIPFINEYKMGFYDSKLSWHTAINNSVNPNSYSNWLKRQSKRYNQKRLMRML